MRKALPLLPRLSTVPSFTRFRMSKMSSNPSPKCPKFVSVEGGDIHSRSQPDGFRFRLVSYNILAQVYVKNSRFPYSPRSCLRWKTRSQRTLSLLKNLEAAFFCLQEVDEYDEYYRDNMGKDGYSSIYIQRSGQKRDGCGIFYKQDKAELVLEERIEYDDLAKSVEDKTDIAERPDDELSDGNKDAENKHVEDSTDIAERPDEELSNGNKDAERSDNELSDGNKDAENKHVEDSTDIAERPDDELSNGNKDAERSDDELSDGNKDAENKPGPSPKKGSEDHGDLNDPRVRLKRDCVGIMAAFRLKDSSGTVIILANTHIYWDPQLADVKLAQANYLLTRLARFRTLVSETFECTTPPVIVAGDFNSTPGDKVYQYLVSGDLSSSAVPERVDESPIPLCSVYASTRGKEPPFTNCTPGFTDTIDYILFSPSSSIKPVSILELPESESLDVAGGLPNHHHPSDHLPIGAEFEVVS